MMPEINPPSVRHDREEPGPAHRPDHWLSLAHRPRWQIARDTAKEEFGGQSNRPCEKNRPKPGHQPDDSPEHQPFREVPRAFEPATFRSDGRADVPQTLMERRPVRNRAP